MVCCAGCSQEEGGGRPSAEEEKVPPGQEAGAVPRGSSASGHSRCFRRPSRDRCDGRLRPKGVTLTMLCLMFAVKKKVALKKKKFPLVKKQQQQPVAEAPPATPTVSGAPVVETGVTVG